MAVLLALHFLSLTRWGRVVLGNTILKPPVSGPGQGAQLVRMVYRYTKVPGLRPASGLMEEPTNGCVNK